MNLRLLTVVFPLAAILLSGWVIVQKRTVHPNPSDRNSWRPAGWAETCKKVAYLSTGQQYVLAPAKVTELEKLAHAGDREAARQLATHYFFAGPTEEFMEWERHLAKLGDKDAQAFINSDDPSTSKVSKRLVPSLFSDDWSWLWEAPFEPRVLWQDGVGP